MIGKKKQPEVRAFLGSGTEFDGKLIFSGSVRIDGNFTGEIIGGGLLVIGEGAKIQGKINTDHILISGDVLGNLDIKEKVEIYPKGRLFGEMKTPALVVQDGGIFEGKCLMGNNGSGYSKKEEI